MPGERLSMRKIREVLRLRFAQGLSQRAIAGSAGLSIGAVNGYLSRARVAGLNWPLPEELGDAQLETLLYPPLADVAPDRRLVPDWAAVPSVSAKKPRNPRLAPKPPADRRRQTVASDGPIARTVPAGASRHPCLTDNRERMARFGDR